MITREQAEQAFREFSESMKLTYEIRDFRLEQMIDTSDIGSSDELPMLEDDLVVDLAEEAWLCRYERRYNRLGYVWHKATCYIVEAKPGPFVIE